MNKTTQFVTEILQICDVGEGSHTRRSNCGNVTRYQRGFVW